MKNDIFQLNYNKDCYNKKQGNMVNSPELDEKPITHQLLSFYGALTI